jgi:hypothetical protein
MNNDRSALLAARTKEEDNGMDKHDDDRPVVNNIPSPYVSINMHIKSGTLVFGIPIMLTVIILGSMIVSWIFRPAPVVPQIEVNVPPSNLKADITLPSQNVTYRAPDLHLSQSPTKAPDVNITTPKADAPNITFMLQDGKKDGVQIIEKVVEKIKEVQIGVYVDSLEKANVTLKDVFPCCEEYINKWCVKNGKDIKAENKRWLDNWTSRVTERGNEQTLANEMLAEKREALNPEKSTPVNIVEMCRVMLRYRDAGLAVPSLFKEYVTADNLLKLKASLERGP